MANILIVEDEFSINELICRSLQAAGHHCVQVFTAMEAIKAADKEEPDLVLLDVNLPDLDGFALYKHLEPLPVIYVTARDEIGDKLRGLASGAEDYVVKPFDIQELIARVNLVLRRNHRSEEAIKVGEMVIDLERQTVHHGKELVSLSNREFQLLRVLLEHKNMVLSRRQLLELAWDMDYQGEERTVDVHIRRLRQKLRLEDKIKTVFKAGYRLEL
ncbi:MAG: response regulator transcription factor [Bacillota bacterium]|nr:response regulator transcription factor [Bacillota bacterium]